MPSEEVGNKGPAGLQGARQELMGDRGRGAQAVILRAGSTTAVDIHIVREDCFLRWFGRKARGVWGKRDYLGDWIPLAYITPCDRIWRGKV